MSCIANQVSGLIPLSPFSKRHKVDGALNSAFKEGAGYCPSDTDYGQAHMRACANQQATGVYHDPAGKL